MFSHTQLKLALSSERFGHPLYYFPTIGSTNDEAKRFAAAGAPEGTMIVADEQTAGRGRSQREWVTPRGTDLAITLLLRPDVVPSRLAHVALMGGLAAACAIEAVTGLAPQLKWPNDVCIDGRKTCGVLADISIQNGYIQWIALGIGINVNGGPPVGMKIRRPATSLSDEVGQEVDRLALLVNLSRELGDLYPSLGGQVMIEGWEARMMWRGTFVRVLASDTCTSREGVLLGLTSDGALRLQQSDGNEITVASGDVSLVQG